MANDQENIKLNFDSNAGEVAKETNKLGESLQQTEKTFESMKTQVRKANQEMARAIQLYGETSTEAVNAAKKVAQLNDQIEFGTNLSNSFNPDQKFKALGAATQVAATGIQGVTAGMALFGDQSKDVEQMLLKVQAAMAFSDAVSNLSNLGDQWATLKTVVLNTVLATEASTVATVESTIATEASTVALETETVAVATATKATWLLLAPIVAVTAGLSALVYAIGYFTGAWGDYSGKAAAAEKITKKVNAELDTLETTVQSNSSALSRYNNHQLEMARASGKSAEEIHKLELELAESETNEARRSVQRADRLQREALRGGDAETIERATKFLRDMEKLRNEAFQRELDINDKFEVEKRQAQTDANERALQARREANQKIRDEEASHRKKLKEEKEQFDKETREGIAQMVINEINANAQLALEADENAVKKKEAQQKSLEEISLMVDTIEGQTEEQARKRADEQIRIAEAVAEAQKTIEEKKVNVISQGISLIAQLFGKNKIIQKAALLADSAVGIAKSIISTKVANAAVTAKYALIPGGVALATAEKTLNNISAGIGIAANVAATSKALSALGGGGGSSGGNVGGGEGGGAVASEPPPQVAFNNTAQNQIGQSVARSQADQPPIEVFVKESEIRKAQNNVEVLVKTNTF